MVIEKISEVIEKDKNVETTRKVENESICVKLNIDENNKDIEDTELIQIVQKSTKPTGYETIKILQKEETEQKKLVIGKLISILNAISVSETKADKKKEVDVFCKKIYLKTNDKEDKNMESHSSDERNGYQNET